MNSLFQKLTKTKVAVSLAGWIFSNVSGWLPLKRIRENDTWLAFLHPKPTYPIHIVIVPKRKVKDWMALTLNDALLYEDFLELTQGMIRDFCLEETGYRLIVNGGKNQTFPHMHVHLVAGDVK